MMVIYKYAMRPPPADQVLMLPTDAKVLAFQLQGDQPCMWVLLDPDAEKKPRCFQMTGTGHGIFGEFTYIGTIQQPAFVWHLLERHGDWNDW